MIELGVSWATLAVKTATIGFVHCPRLADSMVLTMQLVVLEVDTGFPIDLMVVQSASLGIDLVVFYLVQLTPEDTLLLLDTFVILSAVVLVVSVGLVLLLLTWKFPL